MFVVLLVLKTEVPNWVLKEMTNSAYDSDREDRGDSDLEEGNITQKTLEKPEVEHKE